MLGIKPLKFSRFMADEFPSPYLDLGNFTLIVFLSIEYHGFLIL